MYSSYYGAYQFAEGMGSVLIIGLIGGIILGIILAVVFMPSKKRNDYRNKPGLLFLHDFLNFKSMIIGIILKVTYIIFTFVLTLLGLYAMFTTGFGTGILILIFGNVLLRILYEQMMILFSIHENMNKITNQITGNKHNQDSSASTEQFFDNMSDKIKQQQEKMRERREEEAARRQEQQYFGNDNLQNPPANNGTQDSPVNEPPQVKTVFCTKCGQPIKEGYKFCVKCGNPIDPQ